ncbi:hypothetical protein BVF91_11620 [Thermoanaerobacterium sp. PSU-2]|uniref:phage major capsid protein n=1 Tax=Thermoanaerobacterium sp. PSU-2 TaxID=1930849 RepID=UPI000A161A39|nr:phage major capsid protein [Thermoanaerobacterium sp. PSU-2]ORX22482.1 hypothetical protein BVF91_11620 [Thermoanaerobacterium sp. PSU-2]
MNIFEEIKKQAQTMAEEDAKEILKGIVNRKIKFPEGGADPVDKKFSFLKAIKGVIFNDWRDADFEKKALTEGTGSAGGYLVPPEYSTQLIQMVYAKTVVRKAGATVIPMNSNILYIPKQNGTANATWIGENTAISDTNPTFTQVQLTAKKLAALAIFSNELLQDSNPQVESVVMNDLANVLAVAQDNAFLQGTGTNNQPKGIINQSGINTISAGANGADLTYDMIIDAIAAIQKASLGNFKPNAIIMHPSIYYKAMKQKDSMGRYLIEPIQNASAATDFPGTIMGIPVLTTTTIPTNLTTGTANNTSYVILGQFDEAIIGERGGVELLASNTAGNFFTNDVMGIRATVRLDFALRYPEAFCVINGVIAA